MRRAQPWITRQFNAAERYDASAPEAHDTSTITSGEHVRGIDAFFDETNFEKFESMKSAQSDSDTKKDELLCVAVSFFVWTSVSFAACSVLSSFFACTCVMANL